MRFWQAIGIFSAVATLLGAEEKADEFEWDPPNVAVSVFTQQLGMLNTERDEYATNLASHAVNGLAAAEASPAALGQARRMLALALHLSPRNKRAVVVNFQLSKGILPEAAESAYSPSVFARLILTRGQLLEKQGGGEDRLLARYFIQLSAEMDPRNEDAVYASEVQRLDHGTPDWKALTDQVEKNP